MRDSLPQPTPGLTHDRERPQGVAPDRIAPQRIAKVLARAGLCSRRDAERWIAEGRVAVDGTVLTTPAVTVTPDSNIRVAGKPLPQPERARLWRYDKPEGLVPATRLIRLAYGPFQLGHLARGMIEEVPGKVLQEQLGVGGKGARGRHARNTDRVKQNQ